MCSDNDRATAFLEAFVEEELTAQEKRDDLARKIFELVEEHSDDGRMSPGDVVDCLLTAMTAMLACCPKGEDYNQDVLLDHVRSQLAEKLEDPEYEIAVAMGAFSRLTEDDADEARPAEGAPA